MLLPTFPDRSLSVNDIDKAGIKTILNIFANIPPKPTQPEPLMFFVSFVLCLPLLSLMVRSKADYDERSFPEWECILVCCAIILMRVGSFKGLSDDREDAIREHLIRKRRFLKSKLTPSSVRTQEEADRNLVHCLLRLPAISIHALRYDNKLNVAYRLMSYAQIKEGLENAVKADVRKYPLGPADLLARLFVAHAAYFDSSVVGLLSNNVTLPAELPEDSYVRFTFSCGASFRVLKEFMSEHTTCFQKDVQLPDTMQKFKEVLTTCELGSYTINMDNFTNITNLASRYGFKVVLGDCFNFLMYNIKKFDHERRWDRLDENAFSSIEKDPNTIVERIFEYCLEEGADLAKSRCIRLCKLFTHLQMPQIVMMLTEKIAYHSSVVYTHQQT
jgi:hypothetical protein